MLLSLSISFLMLLQVALDYTQNSSCIHLYIINTLQAPTCSQAASSFLDCYVSDFASTLGVTHPFHLSFLPFGSICSAAVVSFTTDPPLNKNRLYLHLSYVLVPIIFTSFAFSAAANISAALAVSWSTRTTSFTSAELSSEVYFLGLFLKLSCQASLFKNLVCWAKCFFDYPSGIATRISTMILLQSSVFKHLYSVLNDFEVPFLNVLMRIYPMCFGESFTSYVHTIIFNFRTSELVLLYDSTSRDSKFDVVVSATAFQLSSAAIVWNSLHSCH